MLTLNIQNFDPKPINYNLCGGGLIEANMLLLHTYSDKKRRHYSSTSTESPSAAPLFTGLLLLMLLPAEGLPDADTGGADAAT